MARKVFLFYTIPLWFVILVEFSFFFFFGLITSQLSFSTWHHLVHMLIIIRIDDNDHYSTLQGNDVLFQSQSVSDMNQVFIFELVSLSSPCPFTLTPWSTVNLTFVLLILAKHGQWIDLLLWRRKEKGLLSSLPFRNLSQNSPWTKSPKIQRSLG